MFISGQLQTMFSLQASGYNTQPGNIALLAQPSQSVFQGRIDSAVSGLSKFSVTKPPLYLAHMFGISYTSTLCSHTFVNHDGKFGCLYNRHPPNFSCILRYVRLGYNDVGMSVHQKFLATSLCRLVFCQ